MTTAGFERFIDSAPRLQRTGMRVLLALARRPRGAALLSRSPIASQAAGSLLAMSRYDDPVVSRTLGWDAQAVAARGRELRRAEGRP